MQIAPNNISKGETLVSENVVNETTVGEKKKKSPSVVVTALAIVCIVALIGLTASLIVYNQQNTALQNKDSQIASLQSQLGAPKLVSIGFNYTDNRANTNAPFLHITGYVVNVGGESAKNCTIHVNAVQNGNETALNTTTTVNSLDAGAYEAIDIQFPYTGQALVAYTSYLTWSN